MALIAAVMAGCAASPAPPTARYDGPPGAYPAGAEGEGAVAGPPEDSDAPVEDSPGPDGWAGPAAGPGFDDSAGASVPDDRGADLDGADLDDPNAGPGTADRGEAAGPDAADRGEAARPDAADRGEAARPDAADPGDVAPVVEPAAARRPGGMTDFEVGVAAAASRLRRDPRWLVGALGRYRSHYRGRRMHLPGMDAAIVTVEGVAAVDEAIAVARRSKPRPALRLSAGLSRAARAHARELGRAGSLEHAGRDGSQPHERMARHGRVIGLSGENIGTGWGDAEVMLIGLYVDDGVRGRGHRVNLLEPEFRAIGVGCAPHRMYGTVCVLDFAGELRE
jgi:hypothetical protein